MVRLCFFFLRNHDSLIPDAPELIANFLEGEQDASCKRNAFMMLIHADQVGFIGIECEEEEIRGTNLLGEIIQRTHLS